MITSFKTKKLGIGIDIALETNKQIVDSTPKCNLTVPVALSRRSSMAT